MGINFDWIYNCDPKIILYLVGLLIPTKILRLLILCMLKTILCIFRYYLLYFSLFFPILSLCTFPLVTLSLHFCLYTFSPSPYSLYFLSPQSFYTFSLLTHSLSSLYIYTFSPLTCSLSHYFLFSLFLFLLLILSLHFFFSSLSFLIFSLLTFSLHFSSPHSPYTFSLIILSTHFLSHPTLYVLFFFV